MYDNKLNDDGLYECNNKCGRYSYEDLSLDYETMTAHCPNCGEYLFDLDDVEESE